MILVIKDRYQYMSKIDPSDTDKCFFWPDKWNQLIGRLPNMTINCLPTSSRGMLLLHCRATRHAIPRGRMSHLCGAVSFWEVCNFSRQDFDKNAIVSICRTISILQTPVIGTYLLICYRFVKYAFKILLHSSIHFVS